MSYKKFMPEVRFNGEKIDPDEINRYEQYCVIHPTISTSWVGTAAGGTWVQAKVPVLLNKSLDYPRNLLFTITNTAGSLNGGSVYVVGKDQFGGSIDETIGYNLGTEVQSKSGSKIFSQVSAATVTFGSAQLNAGTAGIGCAFGTLSGSNTFQLGLPLRIGAATDVIAITHIANGVVTTLNAGTPSALVSTTTHSFTGTSIMAATDSFALRILSTYNGENTDKVA